MFKRLALMLILSNLVLGGVYGFLELKKKLIANALAGYAAAPKTVSAIRASFQDWQPETVSVGTIKAAQGVEIASEAAGIVEKINFESGQDVPAGTILVQLRLDAATSRLKELQAAAGLAEVTFQRDSKIIRENVISQSALDADTVQLKSAQAQVQAQQALIDEKTIRAPFSGKLGIRKVNLGQYLNPGTPVVSLESFDTLYVDFCLPQQMLGALSAGQPVKVTADTFLGTVFSARISAIDSDVDPGTRNVTVRATLENSVQKLIPGTYATVAVINGPKQELLTLPQSAIVFNPFGATAFIVDTDSTDAAGNRLFKVRQSFVKTGLTRGDQIAVTDGIKEGDTVVTAGQGKLTNGTAVIIDNSIQPSGSPNPSVAFE